MIAEFKDHLNRVLHRTLTEAPLSLVNVTKAFALRFRRSGGLDPAEVPIQTQFGITHLNIAQTCLTERESDGEHRLRTIRYRYALRPEGDLEPRLRWEYVREFSEGNPCRHHLQGPISVPFGRHDLNLKDLHLPTGYTTIEDVIRFCIVDLGATPLSSGWHEVLEESYRLFKTKFAPRGPGA